MSPSKIFVITAPDSNLPLAASQEIDVALRVASIARGQIRVLEYGPLVVAMMNGGIFSSFGKASENNPKLSFSRGSVFSNGNFVGVYRNTEELYDSGRDFLFRAKYPEWDTRISKALDTFLHIGPSNDNMTFLEKNLLLRDGKLTNMGAVLALYGITGVNCEMDEDEIEAIAVIRTDQRYIVGRAIPFGKGEVLSKNEFELRDKIAGFIYGNEHSLSIYHGDKGYLCHGEMKNPITVAQEAAINLKRIVEGNWSWIPEEEQK